MQIHVLDSSFGFVKFLFMIVFVRHKKHPSTSTIRFFQILNIQTCRRSIRSLEKIHPEILQKSVKKSMTHQLKTNPRIPRCRKCSGKHFFACSQADFPIPSGNCNTTSYVRVEKGGCFFIYLKRFLS